MIDFRINTICLIAFWTISFNNASAQAPASWVACNSYDGRFQVLSPGQLLEKTDSVDTPLGKLAYRVHFYQSGDKTADNLLYMISWCDYPEGSIAADSTDLLEAFFDATMESAAFSVKGKVVYSDAYSQEDYPGRIWRIDYLDGNAIIKTRAFVVGSRYYALQTVALKEKHLNPSAEKFFDSFRLVKSSKPTTAKRKKSG